MTIKDWIILYPSLFILGEPAAGDQLPDAAPRNGHPAEQTGIAPILPPSLPLIFSGV